MRDHTKLSRGRDVRTKRKEVRQGLLTLLVGIEFIIALFGAAHFENTDDPRGIIIAGAALIVALVVVIIINMREEQ